MKPPKAGHLSLPGHETVEVADDRAAAGDRKVSALDRHFARQMLEVLGNPPIGLRLWNGEEIVPAGVVPVMRAHLRDRGALYKLLINPDLHFGDLYSVGRIEVEGDLVGFLETAYRASSAAMRQNRLVKLRAKLLNRPRANTLTDSRDNIHHHYDLGNDFYRLWLDAEAMQYTCAYYPGPDMTLEQAQIAKLDHVARKLQLKPGDRVVEAGCGWGGLARHFARKYGVTVRAYNISQQQVAFARERARAEGLDGRVEYVLDDYRNIDGQYDVFVSVGMLEHVGSEQYGQLGDVLNRCLTPAGRGLIHSIGRNAPEKMNAWIEKRIFPGAYPPTLQEMMNIFVPHELSVLDVENLRLHYARTLEHWLDRFEQHAGTAEAMFDQHFVRAWRLYLAGSIAAFTTGALQLFQVVFARPRHNDLPWSRAHIYR
jgi:cyclopropane-fatty-acyl-phospholipid synthase